jgi:ABC-type dipeptide/oligopeptide/nickel transport system permease subunit
MLLAIVGLAVFGPFVAPHSPVETIGLPSTPPASGAPLGTDFLGRDVLSRLCWGGRTVLLLAGSATLIAYAVGLTIGLLAGFVRSAVDPLLMRMMDVLLSIPALVFLLVIITAVGSSEAALVVGVAIVQVPSIARIMRAATLTQSVRGYVEAAVGRAESTAAILRRELLPNISGTIAADAGLRLAYSIILIASVNFLGLGLQPPTSDWGLMIAENRDNITLNPWAVVAPALVIACLTIALNLVGDALASRTSR